MSEHTFNSHGCAILRIGVVSYYNGYGVAMVFAG
jgi:hypothetical protein